MKIMQVIPHLGLGGAESMCENLAEVLVNQGHHVMIVSLYTKETPITARLKKKTVNVTFLDKKPGPDPSVVGRLEKLISHGNPDAIHTHLASLKYVFLACRLANTTVPIIHTVHSIAQRESPWLDRVLHRWLFRKKFVIPVALSEEIRKTILKVYGLDKDSVPVIYNGVQLSKCIAKQSYTADEAFTIVHVGRFYDVKNHNSLIRAFQEIHGRHPDCRLRLIGDGEKKTEMENLAKELGIGSAVDFLGQQTNVFPFLHDADLFILPSLYEGIPLSIIEAMGTGLPIVASRVGGIPDMICDGEEGLLCDPDISGIVNAIEKMYLDEVLRENCGKTAQKSSERFSAEEMAGRYMQLYQLTE